jgi:triacylglycerol lipase
MRGALVGMLIATAALFVPSASAAATSDSRSAARGDAVVFVSGLSNTSPYTKAGHRCRSGTHFAGREATFLYTSFQRAGFRTFVAPAEDGPGPVSRSSEGEFGDCPAPLPVSLTMNTIGALNVNTQRLLNFFRFLHRTEGVRRVWIVAHSMGGLVSRGMIDRMVNSPRRVRRNLPTVRGLITIGTPHIGAFLADIAVGITPQADVCRDDTICNAITGVGKSQVDEYQPAMGQITNRFLAGTRGNPGWNVRRGRVPRSIPVYAMAGTHEVVPGNTNRYDSPNDGYVGEASAYARGLKRNGVLPSLRCLPSFDAVHSVYLATTLGEILGTPPTALTADPAVANASIRIIRGRSVRQVSC